MDQLPHLFPTGTGQVSPYTYAKKVGSKEFKLPPRDRVPHSKTLVQQIQSAADLANLATIGRPQNEAPKGVVFEFQSDPSFKLQLKSLEFQPSGIELRNSRVDASGTMHATVFVPVNKIGHFVGKFEAFADKSKDSAKGKPRNNDLVASISQIRLAALHSFWTDAGPFPDSEHPIWWEVWLQDDQEQDVGVVFRKRSQILGILVSTRELRFPDRRVVLAFASISQLLAIDNLFDLLAELRLAKLLASDFLNLQPRDQAEFVQELLSRLQFPPNDAPSVCHLDTGVNRGHPLLEHALSAEHLLSVDPNWLPTDGHPRQHGTAMAGLALYGCLKETLSIPGVIQLRHRLESVRIFNQNHPHDPDLYGDVTAQATSRIEIAEPMRTRRAFALTITSDQSRDEGFPSSWSAALDQICSGAEEPGRPSRLLFVSAGNTAENGRKNYPDHNQIQGVEDPAQSWNAVSVGAYTEKARITSQEFCDWNPVANAGLLSPASRTSAIWADRSWPIKPDFVMEGGNQAFNPKNGDPEDIDDLMLLTTHLGHSGSLFTSTGDTSAATALAARYAAMIWARYPDLSPEAVRGLLVHSSRWTAPMLSEFPSERRHARMRVYGYGVPRIEHALWSASNNATLIIQDSLQPYEQIANAEGQKRVVTKDLRLHRLPWPKDILEPLGELTVRLRVTLSYYIEPSPGRRGWKHKHRYQSHGLRFDIKRPTDSSDMEFLHRLSKATWDDDQDSVDSVADVRNWSIGPQLRCKGSVHSDVWTGTAAQLASAGSIAVYPVTGWWKERPNLARWDRLARYALIISIETDSAEIDLYTPIENQLRVENSIEIDANQ